MALPHRRLANRRLLFVLTVTGIAVPCCAVPCCAVLCLQAFKGIWRMQPTDPDPSATTLQYALFVRPHPWLPVKLIEDRISAEVVNNLNAVRRHTERVHKHRLQQQQQQQRQQQQQGLDALNSIDSSEPERSSSSSTMSSSSVEPS
jgi:hypothetical protein